MNKDWDRAVIDVDTWKECLRVLKPGAFAAIMSSPRQDVLSRMIVNLQDAGFRTDFTSIYWTYASGFPKAANVSKLVDKRNGRVFNTSVKDYLNQKRNEKGLSFGQINEYLGTATNGGGVASAIMGDKTYNELPTVDIYNKLKTLLDLDNRFDELIEREEVEREIIGDRVFGDGKIYPQTGKRRCFNNIHSNKYSKETKPATEKAKELDGSYAGFQPKPAVEVILMVMKPLSEKTFVDQALANGKGITWLDNVRIPFQDDDLQELKDKNPHTVKADNNVYGDYSMCKDPWQIPKGRFPANLLVSDSVLKDHSRFFDLDKWFETTFPFIITPKPSPAEKNRGLDKWIFPEKRCRGYGYAPDSESNKANGMFDERTTARSNHHPTVKPIKLMSYLIALLTREGETVLDPFCGSGTTLIAAKLLHRKYIGIELNEEYIKIADARIKAVTPI